MRDLADAVMGRRLMEDLAAPNDFIETETSSASGSRISSSDWAA
jgi:hypothetical protein